MSTRSGKRIHNTSNQDTEQTETEPVLKVERKTRSKRVVENDDNQAAIIKTKKRRNYVSYPADEITDSNVVEDETQVKPGRVLRALKDQNAVSDEVELPTAKKQVRQTRRTKKFSETVQEDAPEASQHENAIEVVIVTNGKSKSKKNKNKSKKVTEKVVDKENDVKDVKKKKNKRKKHSQSNSSEEQVDEDGKNKQNDSNMSVDSFHSAAGSPVQVHMNGTMSPKDNSTPHHFAEVNSSVTVSSHKSKNKRKSSLKNKSIDINSEEAAMDVDVQINTTFDKETKVVDMETKRRKSSLKNNTFDCELKSQDSEKLNTTFEKEPANEMSASKKRRTSNLMDICTENTDIPLAKKTLDLNIHKTPNGILNTTFEKDDVKEADTRKLRNSSITVPIDEIFSLNSSQSSKIIVGKTKKSSTPRMSLLLSKETSPLDETFDLSPKPDNATPKSVDTTFDKEPKLNSTFDKTDTQKSNSDSKSSLISSDATESSSNITLDKSDELSKISITDDDSKTENILNTTPVLIESSMEASMLESSMKENKTPESNPQIEIAPLVREGTFTKEEPEVALSPKQTPTKRQTLPAAGCTPYHSNNKGSQKKRSALNVTHSIEKLDSRSTLAEVPRTTRVMFCSPVNNPTVVMQRKSKIIKSNLKGSNKSFVYEETEPIPRAGRKRSFTHSEESEARAKRSRLAEPRPARARTSSAMAKMSTAVTPQKPTTPQKPKSDVKATKLPNFAAMHARRFERMESLDECQQRRARRARHLLEPTGSLAVLERSSPRATLEPPKAKDTPPKTATPVKPAFKLPTLDTLQRGYTRFGFKMNCDVNPFSVPSKTVERKPKEVKAKVLSGLRREKSQPSLAGATSLRRAAAKQTIMREKSFTQAEKIDEKRKECRTVIKGVRTNRRFELQMKSRNING